MLSSALRYRLDGDDNFSNTRTEPIAADARPGITPNADYPNPSGLLRERIRSLYYAINTRIDGVSAAAAPPAPPDPFTYPPTISGTPTASVTVSTP